jgi:hypothetical protein
MRKKQKPKLSDEEIQQKAEEYNNSRPLYVWRVSDHPEVKEVINILFDEMRSQGLVSTRYAEKSRRNLSAVVLDLYVAFLSDPKMYIGYSRNRNDYGKGSRYKALFLSYEHLIKAVDFLIKNDYAEGPKGYRHPSASFKSRTARLRATEKLIDLFKQKKVVPRMMKRDEDEPLIILKDEEGNPIDFEETDETKRMTENLMVINKALEKWAVLLYVTDEELKKINKRQRKNPDPEKRGPIDFTNKRLRRIFNNGRWDQGGRFFGGWWQNIPREYRVHIRLDDKHVVECDYSGLHINMLYAMAKLPMPKGDVYHLDGYSNNPAFRKFVKQLLLTMVNAESKEKAQKAIHSAVHLEKSLGLPPDIPSTSRSDLDPVIDAFEQKHEKIRHYFCTGIGIRLQNLDSKMAEKVMLRFVGRGGGYAILPLHDSFIIHHGLEEDLKEMMDKAFREMFGCSVRVDLKYNSLEKSREKKPPRPPGEIVVFNKTMMEIVAAQKPFSTYHSLLSEHFESRPSLPPKDPQPDPDPIPF